MSTATTELRRFLTITGQRFTNDQPAPEMFSPAVDAPWHELLDTPQYAALCQETAGQPIGHAATGGHGPISWVTAYEEAYGPLPESSPTPTGTSTRRPSPTTAPPAPWSPNGTAPRSAATTSRPTGRRPPTGDHQPHHASAPAHRRGAAPRRGQHHPADDCGHRRLRAADDRSPS
ncbi:hypothetical protein [Streptomyces sp. C10]|uniref:hypothetical protein n=1 Tax=Streptomyces sp. C10 TaxID=531941 RepID=UPI00398142C9